MSSRLFQVTSHSNSIFAAIFKRRNLAYGLTKLIISLGMTHKNGELLLESARVGLEKHSSLETREMFSLFFIFRLILLAVVCVITDYSYGTSSTAATATLPKTRKQWKLDDFFPCRPNLVFA